MDEVEPAYAGWAAELRALEARIAALPKGPERRALSRTAGRLNRKLRGAQERLEEARCAAGWVRSSPLSWVRLAPTDATVRDG